MHDEVERDRGNVSDFVAGIFQAASIRAGATREEVAEALGTAAAVNAGAALVYSARVMDAYAASPDGR